MATHPIKHSDGTVDKRYSVALEWCGHSKQRLVLRFCGEWIDSFSNMPQATLRAIGHRNVMRGDAVFTNQPVKGN
jgi:hypothetical protein